MSTRIYKRYRSKKPATTTTIVKRNNMSSRYRRKRRQKRSDVLTYYPSPDKVVLFPSRLKTKVTVSNYGSSSIGVGTGDLRFAFYLNAPNLPFSITPAGTFTWNGQTAATQQPAGWTQVFNTNMYRNYRVIGSRINVHVMPESVTDPVIVTITPSVNNNVPASVGAAMNQPYTKKKDFAAGKGNDRGLSHYMPVHKFIGVPRKAIEYDLSDRYTGSFAGGPSAIFFWVVNVETADNNVFANVMNIRFTLTYYVELFNMISSSLPQT